MDKPSYIYKWMSQACHLTISSLNVLHLKGSKMFMDHLRGTVTEILVQVKSVRLDRFLIPKLVRPDQIWLTKFSPAGPFLASKIGPA